MDIHRDHELPTEPIGSPQELEKDQLQGGASTTAPDPKRRVLHRRKKRSLSKSPPTLMLGELRHFISLFLKSWNKLSNILHVFLIVMTMQQTLLTYSLHLTLKTIPTLSLLLWDPLTIVLFQLLQLLLHHHLSLLLSIIYGTLRTPGVLIWATFS